MAESQKQASELTVLAHGTYGAKRASVVAVVEGSGRIDEMEDLAEAAESDEKLAAALAAGIPLWVACGYESDDAVVLSEAPTLLAEGPDDAREFTYGTPVIDPAGHEILIFALDH